MGLPDLNTIAEMVGLVASLIGIWEFVRRSLLKKTLSVLGHFLKKACLSSKKKLFSPWREPWGEATNLPKEPAFVKFLTLQLGQPIIIKEGPFAGLKAAFERPMMNGRVAILLDLLGRTTRLVLSETMISAP